MFVLLSQAAYFWLQGVGVGYVPMVGAYYHPEDSEDGDMTVLHSRDDRGVDVTPVSMASVRVEAFSDRLDCPDAMDRDKLNELACRMLWQI